MTTSDYVVDPGGSNLYATVDGTPGVDLLTLDGSKPTVSQSGGAVHVDGTVARVSGPAAAALDQAFGTDALKAGVPRGVVHIVATGRPGS